VLRAEYGADAAECGDDVYVRMRSRMSARPVRGGLNCERLAEALSMPSTTCQSRVHECFGGELKV
jgi:hypothetical protein